MKKIKSDEKKQKIYYEKPTIKYLGKVSELVKGGGNQSGDGAWSKQDNPIS